MKKIISLASLAWLTISLTFALDFTIIESQSLNSGHYMDAIWKTALQNLGHTANIVSAGTLDSNAFFATTDVLIIASGVNPISAGRRAMIQQYLQQGGYIYIQTEYLPSFETNQTYASIVNNTGGTFAWASQTTSGALAPMNVLGTMSNSPNPVSSLNYFWYGNAGIGSTHITPFLERNGQFYGFIFCAPGNANGKLITTSDQDWVINGSNPNLLVNIISEFENSFACNSVLPVTMGHFNAEAQSDVVKLSWSTSSELNSAWFILERSEDNGEFEEISRQPAAGQSDETLHYKETDYQPLPGKAYYRLRQQDLNGNIQLSEIKEVSYRPEWDFARIWPNPLPQDKALELYLHSATKEQIQISIYTINGQLAINKELTTEPGYQQHSLDIPRLPAGLYQVLISSQHDQKSIKLMIR